MASKRKVNLDDYQLTTTLGTGKNFVFRIIIHEVVCKISYYYLAL